MHTRSGTENQMHTWTVPHTDSPTHNQSHAHPDTRMSCAYTVRHTECHKHTQTHGQSHPQTDAHYRTHLSPLWQLDGAESGLLMGVGALGITMVL